MKKHVKKSFIPVSGVDTDFLYNNCNTGKSICTYQSIHPIFQIIQIV